MQENKSEFTGKITHVLPTIFIPKKDGSGEYQKNEFVVMNTAGKYPESCKFILFNKPDTMDFVKVGNIVNVGFNFKTNEYNDKFYTDANAWRVTVKKEDNQTAPVEDLTPPTEEEGDLPF